MYKKILFYIILILDVASSYAICDLPKVSIIIPIYNQERWLKCCLDSIVNQTYRNIEIICINDGSSDDSSKILDKYAKKDNRIIVINQQNSGVSAARNAGLNIATGEGIIFVDSDDYIHPQTVEIAVKTMQTYNVDLVEYYAVLVQKHQGVFVKLKQAPATIKY